jgi:biofilm protein TabA
MILSTLDKSQQYANCYPGLARGFEFLRQPGLANHPDGKLEIDGDRLFAIFAHEEGRGRDGAYLEFHRRYIDIQFVIEGSEVIGWQPLATCQQVKQVYDQDRDLGFFSERPTNWLEVSPGSFAIFFPHDAHAPLASSGPVHKVVIKVAV